jgi:hypothetical protein
LLSASLARPLRRFAAEWLSRSLQWSCGHSNC